MRQLSLFDLDEGERRRDRGKADVAQSRETLLRIARGFAREIALSRVERDCTADDVARMLIHHALPLLGNAAGSLFNQTEWEFTGEWRASERASNHGHQNRVWRLREHVRS